MMEDPSITQAPMEHIRTLACNAEWALQIQRDALCRVFDEMDDPYLRTRKDDVDHVIRRVQRLLIQANPPQSESAPHSLHGRIILADDLAPADTLWMQHQGIAGFVTEFGGPMSHTAILARSLDIPAVVGVHGLGRYIREGEELVVDGHNGQVLTGLDVRTRQYYEQSIRREQERRAALHSLIDAPTETQDGLSVQLLANIELPNELDRIHEVGAEGVGLYRTEFLFMNRTEAPDEDEQFEVYLRVVKALEGRPVHIRTLDLGADKSVDGSGPVSVNPALGLRAIRLCLQEADGLFRPQIRAILRAAAHGPVRLMLPMLSQINEVRQARRIIEEEKAELERRGEHFDRHIAIGGMIEVPAAALAARCFVRELDFLSIGTNDLIQYTLAVDRMDDEVNYLYDPLHPAVLELIRTVIEAGTAAGIPVAMCGEMAGDPRYTRLLLAMGLQTFSMHPTAMLEIKNVITCTDVEETRRSGITCLDSMDPDSVNAWVERLNQDLP